MVLMLMDKQIETIFKKISNDSSLLEKLLKIDDINKLVDFFISLGCEMPKDELTEYLGNMCKNILSDKTMENIAGGKSLTNHNLSKILSTSLATISLANPIISAAPPPKATNPKVQTQTEENTESKTNTALEHVKKHAAEYAIGAGVTIGGLVWGAHKLLGGSNPGDTTADRPGSEPADPQDDLTLNENDPINPNDPITPVNPEECVRAISQARWLTGDQWFNKLCGNVDLNDYLGHINNYSPPNDADTRVIGTDVPRMTVVGCSSELSPGVPNPQRTLVNSQLTRILSMYHGQQGHCHFRQQHGRLLEIIYGKFVLSRSENRDRPLSLYDEAKVYFIYSKFIELFESFNGKYGDRSVTLCRYYAERFRRACVGDFEFCRLIGIDSLNVSFRYYGIFLAAGDNIFLGIKKNSKKNEAVFKIWDFILSNNDFLRPDRTGFVIKPTLYALNDILLSHICLFYRNNPNDMWCQGTRALVGL